MKKLKGRVSTNIIDKRPLKGIDLKEHLDNIKAGAKSDGKERINKKAMDSDVLRDPTPISKVKDNRDPLVKLLKNPSFIASSKPEKMIKKTAPLQNDVYWKDPPAKSFLKVKTKDNLKKKK